MRLLLVAVLALCVAEVRARHPPCSTCIGVHAWTVKEWPPRSFSRVVTRAGCSY